MEPAQHKRRNTIQNIVIILLSISAVLLSAQTQLYTLAPSNHKEKAPGSSGPTSYTGESVQLSDLAAPVQVAVNTEYGRIGCFTLTSSDSSLSALLGQALESAGMLSSCSETAFRSVLSQTSVYYNFLQPLPLSILAGVMRSQTDHPGILAQQLVVALEDGQVRLYLADGDDTFLFCSTAVSENELQQTISNYTASSVVFAFDQAETTPQYAYVDPYSLFQTEQTTLPVLSASTLSSDTDSLLRTLQFNANNKDPYTESNGTSVFVEGDRTLHIRPDGTLLYQSGGESILEIDGADDTPTMQEAVTGCATLLYSLLNSGSDATLYVQEILQTGSTCTVRFGYQVEGTPIRFSDGTAAAEVVLSGTVIDTLSLHMRQYTITSEDSLFLPLQQAIAIAAKEETGALLSIRYADDGSSTVQATWMFA